MFYTLYIFSNIRKKKQYNILQSVQINLKSVQPWGTHKSAKLVSKTKKKNVA